MPDTHELNQQKLGCTLHAVPSQCLKQASTMLVHGGDTASVSGLHVLLARRGRAGDEVPALAAVRRVCPPQELAIAAEGTHASKHL